MALVVFDNPIDDAESQARPSTLARRLGGEEGLEDVIHDVVGDSLAGIAHDQFDVLAGGDP